MLVIKESPDLDLLDLAATLATSCVSASVCWLVVTEVLMNLGGNAHVNKVVAQSFIKL